MPVYSKWMSFALAADREAGAALRLGMLEDV